MQPLRITARHRSAGFTLVELLIVMVIVGVLFGLVVLDLTGSTRDEEVEREAERVALVIELARERSLLGSEEWGFQVRDNEYRFHRLDVESGQWEVLEQRPFGARQMPEGVELDLRVERPRSRRSTRSSAQPTVALGRARRGERPDLLIQSDGRLTPFSLVVARAVRARADADDEGWTVISDGIGAATAARTGSAEPPEVARR